MNNGLEQMGIDLSDTLGALTPEKKVQRTVTVKEAQELLVKEEQAKLVNEGDIYTAAIKLAESSGIIFIDEIDKITSKSQQNSGEVSREGVQRDILPIVEAIERIAQIAFDVNRETDNIGARRLHTILEKLLEDLLFEAPDMQMGEIKITEAYVDEKLASIAQNKDLSRFIL